MAKTITVGSLESSDCMITLKEGTGNVHIESVVAAAFYDHIETLVRRVLKTHEVRNVDLTLEDRGALDYAIEARLIAAIKRYKGDDNG